MVGREEEEPEQGRLGISVVPEEEEPTPQDVQNQHGSMNPTPPKATGVLEEELSG